MQYSIVYYSEVLKNADFRFDAEYYHPEFIENSKLISSSKKIKDFISQNVQNIKSAPINRGFDYLEISKISLENCVYETTKIQYGEEPDRAHHILEKEDIAISTVRPNRNAVAFIQKNGIVGSSGLSILRANNIEPEYLFAFCKTNYFIKSLMQANKASMYPAVSNNDILNTPLFIPSPSFKTQIVESVKNSFIQNQKAKELYNEAERILLAELGLINWKEKHRLWFVKNYSDTQEAERIDAEYFQPKYDEIINTIKNYSGGWDTLGNLATIIDKNFEPKDRKKYKYIELSNIGSNGEITNITTEEGQHLPTRARRIVLNENIIVSSIEGSLSSIALIEKEYDNTLCSTGFYVINSKSLNSEILLVLLRSIIGQLQLKKGCKGTILTAISKDEFTRIILPKITKKIQTKIQQKIEESFRLRQQSKHLLECAKKTVEIAIEKDEQLATQWLEKEVKQSN